MELLSIVVPCWNEEAGLARFYAETAAVCAGLEAAVEFIFVDDGSRDGTLAALKELAARDGRVRWLALSRNFGKEAALFAGLEHARGDYVAVMDRTRPPSCRSCSGLSGAGGSTAPPSAGWTGRGSRPSGPGSPGSFTGSSTK